jgi:hypothetical protein
MKINLPGNAVVGASFADSIAIDPADSTGGTAYAVVNTFTGGGKHVFMTTNFGANWTDQFFKGVETVNPNGTVTVTYSLFGVTLLTATYDDSGNFLNASIFGISIPNRLWFM